MNKQLLMKRYTIKSDFSMKIAMWIRRQWETNVTSAKVFYCLLPAYSFHISQSDFLESDILKVEAFIKHYIHLITQSELVSS